MWRKSGLLVFPVVEILFIGLNAEVILQNGVTDSHFKAAL